MRPGLKSVCRNSQLVLQVDEIVPTGKASPTKISAYVTAMMEAMCNSLAQRRDERSQLRAVPRRIIVQFKQRDGCESEGEGRR